MKSLTTLLAEMEREFDKEFLNASLIDWIYLTNNAYERGDYKVKLADFDRIRYFILAKDADAYYVCID